MKQFKYPKDRIIVALDVNTLEEAGVLVKELKSYVGYFKVGLQLLTREGAPKVVEFIHSLGGKIFFDGKFDDIPNTIEGASKAVVDMGVDIFNIHASAGFKSLESAAKSKGNSKLLAVTVLTSIDDTNSSLVFGEHAEAKVLQLARYAKSAGCDGVICSPKELEILGLEEFKGFMKVTPGIRPEWAKKNDQQRITTPADAIKAGATALVIGRPITQPPAEIGGPKEAVKKILEEISEVI